MLSIGKMVAGSEKYYLDTVAKGREEYYTGSGEAPGQWLGSGSLDLGLVGEVAPDDLTSVLSGIAPDGRSLMAGRARPEGRVSGFDFTFSAPKSVSLLFGLGDPSVTDVVRRVHAEAVADALGYLERNALRVQRGAGGERRIGAEGLVAAGFQHRTSRAGDPQLHTHVLVANAALGEDGVWSAPDARLLYFSQIHINPSSPQNDQMRQDALIGKARIFGQPMLRPCDHDRPPNAFGVID